jgi:hypothetical protein
MKVGVGIKPNTMVSDIEDIIPLVDTVLVMTVEPGFGGQSFMGPGHATNDVLPKVFDVRTRFPDKDIEVDGGLSAAAARACWPAQWRWRAGRGGRAAAAAGLGGAGRRRCRVQTARRFESIRSGRSNFHLQRARDIYEAGSALPGAVRFGRPAGPCP